jgi:lysozyme
MANIDNAIKIASEFIKKWEKLSSSSPTSNRIIKTPTADNTPVYAYYDSLGQVWTIGWGNTYYANGNKVNQNDKITKLEADKLFDIVVRGKESAIRSFIPYQNLNDNQYAALISIAYNAGEGNLKKSQLTSALNSGKNDKQVSAIIQDSIVTAKGRFVQSLKDRRIDESKLFDGSYNALYSYYLRNKTTTNYTLIGIGLIVITLISYRYYKKNK